MSENLGQIGETATVGEGTIKSLKELLEQKKIAVHNGPFHADDVVCVALLRTLGYKGEILRTRDQEVLQSIVGIDVAGSRTGGQFDHHGKDAQPGVCALTKLWGFIKPQLEDKIESEKFETIIGQAFAAVADIDSGSCRNPAERPSMFGWVSLLNDGTDVSFFVAVGMACTILTAAWNSAKEWSATLAEAKAALTWDGTPPVLETERQGTKCALWHLGCQAPFFVSPHGAKEWAVVQTCPPGGTFNPFGCSRYLPKEWAGLRGEELQKASGYASAIFAFAPGGNTVMAFFSSKEDAIAAATEACK